MKKIISTLAILLMVVAASAQSEFEKWRFINIPDYHKSEGLAINTDARDIRIEEQKEGFVDMYKKHGGELITIPGDIVSGHWYNKKYLEKFRSSPGYASYSASEVVATSAKLAYEGLSGIIRDTGYKNLLVAVGDHEIGDNPWAKNSQVVKHIETFRESFAKVFTQDANGKSRFTANIGNELPRPVGTKL